MTKKSFILATLLTPLGVGLYFFAAGFLTTYQGSEEKHIAIVDPSDILGLEAKSLKDEHGLYFSKSDKQPAELKPDLDSGRYDAILEVPPLDDPDSPSFKVNFFTADNKPLSPALIARLKQKMEERIRQYKIALLGLNGQQIKSIETNVELDTQSLGDEGRQSGNSSLTSAIAAGIGGFMGFVMYLAVFLYGTMVMRSVMEEKTNRIVEVIISSVKPFQLMLGKIIGVGLVGLTQVALWAIMFPIIIIIVQMFWGIDAAQMQAANSGFQGMDTAETQSMAFQALAELQKLNWWVILPLFVFYFLGGYFLYASLFAAVGSAVSDDTGEAQSLTLPIAMPVIIAFMIMVSVVQNPYSKLAVFASLFPLFSPIVMPARLAFSPPWWEVALSVVLLLLSALFFVWLSGRVYRVGILLYGKKATFRELAKWMFAKI